MRRNRRLTALESKRIRSQTRLALTLKDGAPWPVSRIWVAREMGWPLSYVEYLRHNKPSEIERVAVVLAAENEWKNEQYKKASHR
jgi:hypothetical protein